jgi:hypothetical protein
MLELERDSLMNTYKTHNDKDEDFNEFCNEELQMLNYFSYIVYRARRDVFQILKFT